MIKFERLKEIILERNPDVKDVFYNKYEEIAVTFKNGGMYFYKNNNYSTLLSKLNIPACYERDVKNSKTWLEHLKEENHTSFNFGKLVIERNHDNEIQRIERFLSDVETGKIIVI